MTDWENIKVGDPDTTRAGAAHKDDCCTSRYEGDSGWACTRPASHSGLHVASTGREVIAVWAGSAG